MLEENILSGSMPLRLISQEPMKYGLLWLGVLALLMHPSFASDGSYSFEMYRKALKNETNSPLYVLISVKFPGLEKKRICVVAPFLIGAIQDQYHFDYSEAGNEKALQFALKMKAETFVFSDAQAINRLRVNYSAGQLEQMSRALSAYSNGEIRAQLQENAGSQVQRLLLSHENEFFAYRDAIAYVMLDRGILVGIADISGGLYLK